MKFRDWNFMHQVMFTTLMVMALVLMAMASINVFSNLMASGEGVFVKHPWMAAMISMLAAAGSLAVKFGVEAFHSPNHRRRYTQCVYLAASVSLLIWLPLFALKFKGVASEPSFMPLDVNSGDAAGSALVLAQLVAEMLVGAALFQAAMAIYQRYVPDNPEINPDYLANQKDVESQERVLAALMKERRQVTKVVTRLENEREKLVIENATAYIANKARMSIRASY